MADLSEKWALLVDWPARRGCSAVQELWNQQEANDGPVGEKSMVGCTVWAGVCAIHHKSLFSAGWSDLQQKVSSQAPFPFMRLIYWELFWRVMLAFTSTCSELRVDEWVLLMLFCPGSMSSSSRLIFAPFRRGMNPRLRHLTDRLHFSLPEFVCGWFSILSVLTRIVKDLHLHK